MPEARRARLALVTGGTDGIGKEAARVLARTGHRVIVVGRDVGKGRRAARELQESTGSEPVEFMAADLALVSEAERIAEQVASRWDELHVLVHCAGAIRFQRELTPEGIERNFALNYLTRFTLTRRLLPLLTAGGIRGRAARVVVAGGAARGGRIHHEDVTLAERFNVVRSILQMQHANDLWTVELARRLGAATSGPNVAIACLKFGPVRTAIREAFPWWARWIIRGILDPMVGQSPAEAGAAVARLALDPALEGVTGALFEKITRLRRIPVGSRVGEPAEGRRLWELSERLEREAPREPAAARTERGALSA